MAGFSAQAGQVLVRSQAVAGVYQADTATLGVGIKLRSGNFGPNRDLMIPDPEIGGGRDVSDANLGTVSWSGDFEFYARVDSLLPLLKAGMGTAGLVTTTGITTHTFTPSDAAALPFLSVEEVVGSSLEVYRYNDVVVNTLHLEAEANGYLQGTVGMIAANQIAGATKTASPVWDNGPLFVGSNITITYNAVSLPAKSFSLDFTNNIEDDDFRLGSFFVGDLSPKSREVTASFNIREASSALWRQAVYGLPAATAPGGVTTKDQLVITILAYDNIPAGTPTTPFTITITIPKFTLSPYSLSVSGDDIIEDDIDGQAFRPSSATPIMTVVCKTNRALVA